MRFITSKSNLAVALLFLVSPLHAEENGIEQAFQITTMPTGEKIIHWYGKLGRSYFLQVSDPNDHLNKWTWAQIIEGGNNEEISHEVDGTASKGFFRLKYTDRTPSPGFTLDTADFDGDGLSNLDEINPPPPFLPKDATDPLDPDTDKDGMTDGWEKLFAKNLLALGHPAAWWGARYAGLSSGNLNPDIDYTGDDITASELADLAALPSGQQPADGIHMIAQTKRNILGLSVLEPAHDTVPERIEGVYYYSNDGYPGAARAIDSRNQLEPQYLAEQVQLNQWATNVTYSFSNFWVTAHGSRTSFNGEIRTQRQRIVALTPSASPVKRAFLKTLTRRNLLFGAEEIAQLELVELTIPSGKLSSDWIELIPPVIENREHNLNLLPVEVAVDGDRNGEITFDQKDKTTAEKPFRFWINDDDDAFGEGNDTGGTLDRIPAVTPDHQNSFIDFIRDLEDFSRISFKLPDSFWSRIKAGEIQVGFKWSDTFDGNPAVNIFRQANQSGGQVQYFVDESEALDQAGTFTNAAHKVMTVGGSGTAYFPQSFIDKLPTTSAPTYVLFEGAAKGKGKLNLVLKVNGQEVVCDGPWIKLMDVRQFYTRGRTDYTANVISDPWDNPNPHVIASVPDNTPEFVVDPDETKQCIVHVHGWRMTEGDSRNWSEMTFKRLWQLHYKGRFATFRWATFSDDTHPNTSLLTYNRSEYRAWLCGPALAQFVNGLPYPGSRYLVAHSMGNVISGKALQAGMNVNRYAMCNAAMAAMSYDPSITNLPLSASSTPDTDNDPATAAFGLKNRFNDNLTTRINYYLPDDNALQSWIANQIVNKPDLFLTSAYVFNPFDTPGNKIYYTNGMVLPSRRNVASLAEAMGHAVKSRSNAVGAAGYANGCISSKVGMDGFGFGDEHSAEWNWSLTGSYKFWRKLFVSFQIPTTAPQ